MWAAMVRAIVVGRKYVYSMNESGYDQLWSRLRGIEFKSRKLLKIALQLVGRLLCKKTWNIQ